jgi:dTMP kinase
MMSERQGRYVGLEAVDGAGKTTQWRLAEEFDKEHGIGTEFVREPGGTDFGLDIREMILHKKNYHFTPVTEFLLFTADRRHLWDTVIKPALDDDRPVISDRRIESTIAYQSAGGGLPKDTILNISEQLLDPRYMKPDALALLSLSQETRRRRLDHRLISEAADKIESRDKEYLDRVFAEYKAHETLEYATVIDAERSPEEVFESLKPVLFGKYLPHDKHEKIIS